MVNAATDGVARIAEVEAWTGSSSGNSSSMQWLIPDQLGTPRLVTRLTKRVRIRCIWVVCSICKELPDNCGTNLDQAHQMKLNEIARDRGEWLVKELKLSKWRTRCVSPHESASATASSSFIRPPSENKRVNAWSVNASRTRLNDCS